ncbi:hypothetical protein Krac_5918 [Ktedonobacter racemifer DSM 44963]|uniref:Uncharacterized protein n=1 Tax=Ktedonobacter racemifer DSM 44963 TaxID=485913 RepID=D6TX77_KTERA|nr:hypothetical protein Krac_5918 [Ktedonobacter racemifer DSM 44963]
MKGPLCFLAVPLQMVEVPCCLAFFDVCHRILCPFFLDGLEIPYCGRNTSADQKLDIKTTPGVKDRRFGLPQQTYVFYVSKNREEKTTQTDALKQAPCTFMVGNFLFQEKADEGLGLPCFRRVPEAKRRRKSIHL